MSNFDILSSTVLRNITVITCFSLETARAIYRPFAVKLHTRFITLSSILILVCSFALELRRGLSVRYVSNIHVYINGTDYEYSDCFHDVDPKENLVITIISLALGIWLPMLLIAVVYTLIYSRLKKQDKLRRQNSSQISNTQMRSISKTFTVILVTYYVCYLPFTIQYTILSYLASKEETNLRAYSKVHNLVLPFTNFLMFSSSSLNPLIYGRIHSKIYSGVKISIIAFRKKFSPMQFSGCTKLSNPSQANAFVNLGIVNEKNEQTIHLNERHDHLASHLGPGTYSLDGHVTEDFKNADADIGNMLHSNNEAIQSIEKETAF